LFAGSFPAARAIEAASIVNAVRLVITLLLI
jgi:hypothetical protein